MAVNPIDVLLYVPNLIGYARVACLIISLYYALSNYSVCVVFYCLAFTGDLFDGIAARKFNQTSQYGAVLDMITDRVSTTGFIM